MERIEHTLAGNRADFMDALSIAGRKLRTLFDARVRAKGLTLARARTLIHLGRKDGMTQTELAELLDVEGPTMVRLIDGLEGQELIERRAVRGDRRAKQIALTVKGRKVSGDVTRLAISLREEVLDEIPEADLVTATATMRNVIQKISDLAASQVDAA